MKNNFYSAVATLIGAIVGVGIFGMPYVVAKAGFWTGIFFLFFLGGATLLLHLIYGEIVLRNQSRCRFVGYAENYLGLKGKVVASLVSVLMRYGALLAYMIVAGKFLSIIFNGTEFFWSLVFFGVGSVAIFFGLKVVSKIEVLMALFLLVVIGLIFIEGFYKIDYANLTNFNFDNFFLPYGVILWAIGGLPAIPEMKQILKGNTKSLKKAIVLATLIPLLLYAVFIFVVVGVTGPNTTVEAIEGLVQALERTVLLGAVFGFLAVSTSFLILGVSLKKIFWYDYNLSPRFSWFLVCIIPLVCYLLEFRNFIAVISFTGAILTGLEGILLVRIYQKIKLKGLRNPEYKLKIPKFLEYTLIFVLLLGIIYQLVYYF